MLPVYSNLFRGCQGEERSCPLFPTPQPGLALALTRRATGWTNVGSSRHVTTLRDSTRVRRAATAGERVDTAGAGSGTVTPSRSSEVPSVLQTLSKRWFLLHRKSLGCGRFCNPGLLPFPSRGRTRLPPPSQWMLKHFSRSHRKLQ